LIDARQVTESSDYTKAIGVEDVKKFDNAKKDQSDNSI
jgi:hypothetical protein